MSKRKPPAIFFDHIYKAGGSSIDQVLAALVGPEKMSPLEVLSYQDALCLHHDRQVITGHFHFAPGDVLDRRRYHLTMLRHPVDRVLSHYFFSRNNVKDSHNASVKLAKATTLEEFVESTHPAAIDIINNGQTRHFMVLLWDGYTPLPLTEQLRLAKSALDQYDLVGAFPLFEDFIELLCADLGLPFGLPAPHVNATNDRISERELSAPVRGRIEALNTADMELYYYARELFVRKRRREWRGIASRANTQAETNVPPPSPASLPADFGDRRLSIVKVRVQGQITQSYEINVGDFAEVIIEFDATEPSDDLTLGIMIHTLDGRLAFATNTRHMGHRLVVAAPGGHVATLAFLNTLGVGGYSLTAALHTGFSHVPTCYHWKDDAARFRVVNGIASHFDGHAALFPRVTVSRDDGGVVLVERDSYDMARKVLSRPEMHLTGFGARLECFTPLEELRVGEVVTLSVGVTNVSEQTWPVSARFPVCVSYHWIDRANNSVVVFDGLRTGITNRVQPGETLSVGVAVAAPPKPGRFLLELTLMQEYVAWFDAMGVTPLRLEVLAH